MNWNPTIYLVAAIILLAGLPTATVAQDAVYTPAQVAFLNAEIKKAQGRFAVQVSVISGVPAHKVSKLMPTDWRAGDPKFAVIPALERERNAPLTDEQRRQISAADREMKDAIARARIEATKR